MFEFSFIDNKTKYLSSSVCFVNIFQDGLGTVNNLRISDLVVINQWNYVMLFSGRQLLCDLPVWIYTRGEHINYLPFS